MTPQKWSNVSIAMQSALAAAVTITGISKASPGVVSWSTGTDPANGDYVLLTINGMRQLDSRVARVANLNGPGNTFELEGIDTTLFDTFTSGTFQVITFGTSLGTVAGLTASGGDFDFLDVTTVHDNIRRQTPGLPSALQYSFDNIWDVSDAGLIAMKNASDNQAKRAFRIGFAAGAGQKVVFNGYVGCSLVPAGTAQDIVKTPTVITAEGPITTYAT